MTPRPRRFGDGYRTSEFALSIVGIAAITWLALQGVADAVTVGTIGSLAGAYGHNRAKAKRAAA